MKLFETQLGCNGEKIDLHSFIVSITSSRKGIALLRDEIEPMTNHGTCKQRNNQSELEANTRITAKRGKTHETHS